MQGSTYTFTTIDPHAFQVGQTYTVNVLNLTNSYGDPIGNTTSTFTIQATNSYIPTITSVSPSSGTFSHTTNFYIGVTFSIPMNATSVSTKSNWQVLARC